MIILKFWVLFVQKKSKWQEGTQVTCTIQSAGGTGELPNFWLGNQSRANQLNCKKTISTYLEWKINQLIILRFTVIRVRQKSRAQEFNCLLLPEANPLVHPYLYYFIISPQGRLHHWGYLCPPDGLWTYCHQYPLANNSARMELKVRGKKRILYIF